MELNLCERTLNAELLRSNAESERRREERFLSFASVEFCKRLNVSFEHLVSNIKNV